MVRTRFAPSPTGSLHIGGLRTALFSYALAKHSDGDFLLRIEDTDKKREVAGGKEEIERILREFKLSWDGPVYVQSERLDLYKKVALALVKDGNAYEDEGAIRIKIPKGETVSFHDFVLDKEISWQTDILQDLVLLKSDGFPTYHLAVVVDDYDMKISHVLRGHDWLPSTPIHLLLYKFLGYKLPEIGHLTDILDPEGGKLSKRKGSTSVEGLIKEGYLPEAILNFVMLLGWAPKDNREIFNLKEFVEAFDPKGLQKSNPIFNREKLDWFNNQWIQRLSTTPKYVSYISGASVYSGEQNFQKIAQGTAPFVASRLTTLKEFDPLAGFFFEERTPDKSLFGKNYKEHLEEAISAIGKVEPWNYETLNKVLTYVVEKNKFKTSDFFMDLRVALTGSRVTPPINESIAILGKKETLSRLRKLLDISS